jgi:hypothetical protein
MTGMILDAALMLLLVAALAYGVRLEKKLTTLRQGQMAFAGAVNQLNQAAERAERALASLRSSAQETDLLHDRILKAREATAQLETLLARAGDLKTRMAPQVEVRPAEVRLVDVPLERPSQRPEAQATVVPDADDERALRMAALAQRIQELRPASSATSSKLGNVDAIVQALNANRVPKQSMNRPQARSDEDLFAA